MSSDFDDYLMKESQNEEYETNIYLDKRIMNCFSLDMISPPNTPPATPVYDTQQQKPPPPTKKPRRSLVKSSKAIEQRIKQREQNDIPEPQPTKKKRKLISTNAETSNNILKYLKQSQNAVCPNVILGKPTKRMATFSLEEETDFSDIMSESSSSQLTDRM